MFLRETCPEKTNLKDHFKNIEEINSSNHSTNLELEKDNYEIDDAFRDHGEADADTDERPRNSAKLSRPKLLAKQDY